VLPNLITNRIASREGLRSIDVKVFPNTKVLYGRPVAAYLFTYLKPMEIILLSGRYFCYYPVESFGAAAFARTVIIDELITAATVNRVTKQ
jgi:hypothetical protein